VWTRGARGAGRALARGRPRGRRAPRGWLGRRGQRRSPWRGNEGGGRASAVPCRRRAAGGPCPNRLAQRVRERRLRTRGRLLRNGRARRRPRATARRSPHPRARGVGWRRAEPSVRPDGPRRAPRPAIARHARRFRPSTASTAPVRRPEVRLDRGDPAAGLERVAARESAELIVVGARRRGRITAGVLGAVCERLLSTASRPVVVVPPRVAAGGWAPLALEEGAR
jgi:nucleotide-binding universal stress UspA family protein